MWKRLVRSGRPFLLGFAFLLLAVPSAFSAEQSAETILKSKIGQMIMVGFRGVQVDADSTIIRDIRDLSLGGVVLFDYDVPSRSPVRNIESMRQVQSLTRSLQEASEGTLLIAIDQEGGRVNRLKEKFGFPPTRSAQELAAEGPEATREQARETAEVLRSLGINLNFAPVVDLEVNPRNPVVARLKRSFGVEPEVVTQHARIWIEEHRKAGVLSCLKHFPGHGSSLSDSHLGFVDVSQTWSRQELVPFHELIDEDLAGAIMTAHIFHEEWDEQFPATLSRKVLEGLLRRELGYNGVIISDDMQMRAIADHFGLAAAVDSGLRAGLDILLFGNNSVYEPEIARNVVDMVYRLVQDGRIPRSRIEESFQRIQELKERIEP